MTKDIKKMTLEEIANEMERNIETSRKIMKIIIWLYALIIIGAFVSILIRIWW